MRKKPDIVTLEISANALAVKAVKIAAKKYRRVKVLVITSYENSELPPRP